MGADLSPRPPPRRGEGATRLHDAALPASRCAPDARAHARPGAREIDLAGQTLLPGFNEAHNHMISFGLALAQVEAGYPAIRSIAAMMEGFAARARTTPPGEWVRGRGYDDNKLDERRHPTRHDLDAVTPDHPAIVTNASGHMSVVNSRAIRLAGIGSD